MREWSPSSWGRRFTGAPDWVLRLEGEILVLFLGGDRHSGRIGTSSPVQIHQGVFWTDLTLVSGGRPWRVDGIPNRHGADIRAAVDRVVAANLDAERKEREATRWQRFQDSIAAIRLWRDDVRAAIVRVNREAHWLTTEEVRSLIDARPALAVTEAELDDLLAMPDVRAAVDDINDARKAVELWRGDLQRGAAARNEQHTIRELDAQKAFFDAVERTPLTDEQARAVICFDNRVQVVASAGSGKTSTMVAKAAYAVARKLVDPDRIVMLAFNTAAARELEERARAAFNRVGLGHVTVKAKTFHALGIEIIGKATGRKPRVPDWASDTGAGLHKLAQLVDGLKDRSVVFRTQWDLFRLVFGRSVPGAGEAQSDAEWDGERKRDAHRTLRGELVKSLDEAVIANWLFYNGVDYVYERPYEHDTVTPDHSQYRPDFFYPQLGLYHEHFALDGDGNPPPKFKSYLEGVVWKRGTHKRYGTEFIETSSHQLRTGELFDHLATELQRRGVILDPNPDRPLPDGGCVPIPNAELIELLRCFITHAKSNALDDAALMQRLERLPSGSFRFRYELFLQLAQPVRKEWNQALRAEEGIDFEDMLDDAATYVEAGRYESPFDLVMADEFQDASWARARLCLALVKAPGRHLFAVGDDWQSINRFAGADVSVMTGFSDWCGGGMVLRLETTFRCPQKLCDIAGSFVTKNPAQLKKRVQSTMPSEEGVANVIQVDDWRKLEGAVEQWLESLDVSLVAGTRPPGRNGRVSVFILGRYNADRKYLPSNWQRHFGDRMAVSFSTIHSSKGAEADYVLIPGMTRGGFPNQRMEDPVLALAMPGGDSYPFAEERRLFYVALTRARRSVVLWTVRGSRSAFIDELVHDRQVTVASEAGGPVTDVPCPECGRGVVVTKTGKYGAFAACTNYPGCRYQPPKPAYRRPRMRPLAPRP